MMLNKPMFDWITATTFERKNFDSLRFLIDPRGCKPERRLQYNGIAGDGIFMGDAMQNGRTHYMVQASGEMSDRLFDYLSENFGSFDFSITRCDLQVTIPLPDGYNSRRIFDEFQMWDGPGKKRQTSIIQSGDGLDTVYVGSRTSDRFTRIYVKPTDDIVPVLRFECEYKSEHAHRVFFDCAAIPSLKAEILAHEVESLPWLTNEPLLSFRAVLGDNTHKPAVKRVNGEDSTLEWLRRSVTPSLERLLNSHEFGTEVRNLIRSWYNEYC